MTSSPPSPDSDTDTGKTTAGELWAHRDTLEAEAASLLGRMLFAFSHIDVNLGLCLAWADDGKQLEELTPQIAGLTFHKKLLRLVSHVESKLPAGSNRRIAYDRWVERMDKARQIRNRLVHGRWGVEARRNVVVNVMGLPTGAQDSAEYSIVALAAVNEELQWLDRELRRLRTHWPL